MKRRWDSGSKNDGYMKTDDRKSEDQENIEGTYKRKRLSDKR